MTPTTPAATLLDETRTLTLDDQSAGRYPGFAFTVPPGTTSFTASLEVTGEDGAPSGVIDLGCEGADAWRGWSGGARRTFTIAADGATPGYLPGPLEQGTWQVVLGIHALPAGSTTVRVRVQSPATLEVDHGPRTEPVQRSVRGSDRALPAPEGMRWFAGDTHCHDLHSDGSLSLWEVANQAVRSGLDFLCMTDHNTTSHHARLPAVGAAHGITLVPGQEVTTHRGHANAFGDIGFVDFRDDVGSWARTVAERGGLLSINHPVSGDCSWLGPVPDEVGGVEIAHSDHYALEISTASLAWFRRLADERRAKGLPQPSLLGGGDFHDPSAPTRPGTPTTWVCARSNTPEAILEALRAGGTALTFTRAEDPDGDGTRPRLADAPILLRTDEGTLRALDADGFVVVDADDRRIVVHGQDAEVPGRAADGPFHLQAPDRRVVALCA